MSNDIELQKTNPPNLLAMAIQKGADLQQLKELMDLQERWEKKEANKSFLAALSKFQTLVPDLKKNKTAKINSTKGFFSYKYADLGGIASGIKKPLNDCGLSYRWEFEESNDKLKVTCLISHCDGHTERTTMEAGKDNSGSKNDIQQKGSTQTYLQRYTLIGALGLSTAEQDNDARDHKNIEQTEDEILDQWKQTVSDVKSKIELQGLYLKNKKTVDSTPAIQVIFKKMQNQLKNTPNAKITMP